MKNTDENTASIKAMLANQASPMLLLDSNRGVYIPAIFWNDFAQLALVGMGDTRFKNTSTTADGYWDCWNVILNDFRVAMDDGTCWRLHHDGDLWLYRSDDDKFISNMTDGELRA